MPTGSPLDRDAPTADRIEAQRAIGARSSTGPRPPCARSTRSTRWRPTRRSGSSASTSRRCCSSRCGTCPRFAEWYDEADLTDGYHWLRRMLAILQWYRPADRWLLKSPQHLERLGEFAATFPGAVLVQTHRDPVKVVTSTASMMTYGRRMANVRRSSRARSAGTGRGGPTGCSSGTSASATALGPQPGPRRALRRADGRPDGRRPRDLRRAGRELTDDARAAMERYLAERPRGHFGAHTLRARRLRDRSRGGAPGLRGVHDALRRRPPSAERRVRSRSGGRERGDAVSRTRRRCRSHRVTGFSTVLFRMIARTNDCTIATSTTRLRFQPWSSSNFIVMKPGYSCTRYSE